MSALFPPLSSRDLLSIASMTPKDMQAVLSTALSIKADPTLVSGALRGKSVVLLFEKPSLRTRVSFEVGTYRLGGHAFFYDHSAERIGMRESIKDTARNFDRFVHAIVARVFEQSVLDEMAQYARVPVINALSNTHHPCQALADVLTVAQNFGTVNGKKVVYIGDSNNVATSLAQAVGLLGGHMILISPKGYTLAPEIAEQTRMLAASGGGTLTMTDSIDAVNGCDVIYTDAWVSMHHTDAVKRAKALRAYQVNSALMAKASPKAKFMHCLPAERGNEVTDEVMDGEQSVVFDQAENRLHAQNALMLHLLSMR
jgi:ornithine carbamoyltransferase